MGSKSSKEKKKVLRSSYDSVTSICVYALIYRYLNYTELDLIQTDYKIYSEQELKKFLKGNLPSVVTASDPAMELLNLEQNWFGIKNGPSTFGYVHGDIRLPGMKYVPRICSQNFYIDQQLKLWLLDPTTGNIYAPSCLVSSYLVLI